MLKVVTLLPKLHVAPVLPLLQVLSHLLQLFLEELGIVEPALEVDTFGETDQVATGIRRSRNVLSVVEVARTKETCRCRTRVRIGEVMVSVVSRRGSAEIGTRRCHHGHSF